VFVRNVGTYHTTWCHISEDSSLEDEVCFPEKLEPVIQHGVKSQKTVTLKMDIEHSFEALIPIVLYGIILVDRNPEDGASMFLRNLGIYLPNYKGSHSRTQ
jgi:hypothetical protein